MCDWLKLKMLKVKNKIKSYLKESLNAFFSKNIESSLLLSRKSILVLVFLKYNPYFFTSYMLWQDFLKTCKSW